MPKATDLSVMMRARADADGLPSDHDMRRLADKFDAAGNGFYGELQTTDVKTFLSTWAKARRCWCEYTGSALI